MRLIRRVMLAAIVGGAARALLRRRRNASGDGGAEAERVWPDESGGLAAEGGGPAPGA